LPFASGVYSLPTGTLATVGEVLQSAIWNTVFNDIASTFNGLQLRQTAVFNLTAVNFNSANTDNAISIVLPTGTSRYRINAVIISGASASISTATFGLFSATGGGGTTLATAQAITITSASENTNNNMQVFTNILNVNSSSYNFATVYFRVQTAQGSAATANVSFEVNPL
jgi:hypothetical protein